MTDNDDQSIVLPGRRPNRSLLCCVGFDRLVWPIHPSHCTNLITAVNVFERKISVATLRDIWLYDFRRYGDKDIFLRTVLVDMHIQISEFGLYNFFSISKVRFISVLPDAPHRLLDNESSNEFQ